VMCQYPQMVDADGDNKPEFFGRMGAAGNYQRVIPFTDNSTWLMVFDDSLRFEFPPVEFPGLTNILETYYFSTSKFNGYVVSHTTGSADTTVMEPGIMLFSTAGKMIRSRLYSDYGMKGTQRLFVVKARDNYRIYLIGEQLVELNEKLEIVKRVDSPFVSAVTSSIADIDFDGIAEIFIYSDIEESLAVYSIDLVEKVEIKFKTTYPVFKYSNYVSANSEQKLFMEIGGSGYLLKMGNNNIYYLKYAAFPLVYFPVLFFILLIRRINTFQVVQKESLKRRLITLQLQGIRAQLDPHFTFNTLNSVASMIYLEDRKAAYDYMNKFTHLLRGMLNDAERIYRTVGEELEFVTTYLDLEKLRFGEKFSYKLEVGDGVNYKTPVPKLVLQTFAENAIKHGLMPCDKGGVLKIRIENDKEYLKLTIEDNGIGREKAAGRSTSTGKGLKITGEFYDILNQINKKPIKHLITDLYTDSGHPAGTKVEVWVPEQVE
jgi:two-component sensor histidine kinase